MQTFGAFSIICRTNGWSSSSSTAFADRRILRLIQKWLWAGVSEEGKWSKTEVGTPQGAVASPLLANIYLHYVFDLWVKHWRKHQATGDVIVVRYADDIVAGFESRADAERFLQEWKERLQKFGLELHPDKTRLIEFGRNATENRKQRDEGKPEVFDFLGFTHMCGKTRKTGRFIVKRKTIRKRLSGKLSELKEELRRRWHEPGAEVGKWLRSVVQGYFNYHAVPGNMDSLNSFRAQVIWRWYRALRRQLSEVGAVCGNPARTDLRGGRRETAVPTATIGVKHVTWEMFRTSILHGHGNPQEAGATGRFVGRQ